MTLQTPVYVSTQADDGNGDKLRDAFIKINERFRDIASLLQNKGDWATGTQYIARDYVYANGGAYVCVIDHAATTFAADLAAGKWASVDALDLRADLASSGVGKGSELVAGVDTQVADYPSLRAYTGTKTRVYVTGTLGGARPSGIAGVFQYDATDSTSEDNGGTIIVGAGGKRWKRDFSGDMDFSWFGARLDGVNDDTLAYKSAQAVGGRFSLGDGTMLITSSVKVTKRISIKGSGATGSRISRIKFSPQDGSKNLFEFDGVDECKFESLLFVGPGLGGGAEVAINMDDNLTRGAERQNIFEHCHFEDFDKAGILMSGQWHNTVRNCTFSRCGSRTSPIPETGGIVFSTSPALAGWAGSGNLLVDNYFGSCSYGVYDKSAWNVVHINNIFEYCHKPFYVGTVGTMRTFIACWYENNDNPPEILGPVYFISGRNASFDGHNVTASGGGSISTDKSGIKSYRGSTPTVHWNPEDGFKIFKSLRDGGVGFSFDSNPGALYYSNNTNGGTTPNVDLTLNNLGAVRAGARNRNSSYQKVVSLDGYGGYWFNGNFDSLTSGTITGAANTNPVVLNVSSTAGNGKLITGDIIKISDVSGMTQINGNSYKITVINDAQVSLDGVDGTSFDAYVSGGTWSSNRNRNLLASVAPMTLGTAAGKGRGYGRVGIFTGQHNNGEDNDTQIRWFFDYTGHFSPASDNAYSIGSASLRVSQIYAASSTINTSDERDKQQIRCLSVKERAVATRLKSLIRAYKWNRSVEGKGDSARIHFGVIAQDVRRAFEDEGLNALDYGVLCYDEWPDEYEPVTSTRNITGEDGVETVEEFETGDVRLVRAGGNRYGVRYDQLFSMIISSL